MTEQETTRNRNHGTQSPNSPPNDTPENDDKNDDNNNNNNNSNNNNKNNNEKNEKNENENEDHQGSTTSLRSSCFTGPRVAIVGAGFAGLVLANFLERKSRLGLDSKAQQKPKQKQKTKKQTKTKTKTPSQSSCWEYTLFESKPDEGIPVIGTIRLESARSVLEALGLFEVALESEIENGKTKEEVKVKTKTDTKTTLNQGLVFPGAQPPRHQHQHQHQHKHKHKHQDQHQDQHQHQHQDQHQQKPKPQKPSTTPEDCYSVVSRESFLELLRKNVTVRSCSRVVEIILEKNDHQTGDRGSNASTSRSRFTVVTQTHSQSNGDGNQSLAEEHGPFHCVVLSHGLLAPRKRGLLFSERSSNSSSSSSNCIGTLSPSSLSSSSSSSSLSSSSCNRLLRIGDCRLKPWWKVDILGASRRRSGADAAILDGLRVGRALAGMMDTREVLADRDSVGGRDDCDCDCDCDYKNDHDYDAEYSHEERWSRLALGLSEDREEEKPRAASRIAWVVVVVLLPILLAFVVTAACHR